MLKEACLGGVVDVEVMDFAGIWIRGDRTVSGGRGWGVGGTRNARRLPLMRLTSVLGGSYSRLRRRYLHLRRRYFRLRIRMMGVIQPKLSSVLLPAACRCSGPTEVSFRRRTIYFRRRT